MDLGLQSIFGSENPYKFLFLSGVILIVFGLYYPFEKRQVLELKKNQVGLSDSTLYVEINELRSSVKRLKNDSESMLLRIDSLNSLKATTNLTDKIDSQINEINLKFDDKFQEEILAKYSIEKKIIESEFRNRELTIYNNHLIEIKLYSIVFVIVGILFSSFGGIKWLVYFKKRFESNEIKNELN